MNIEVYREYCISKAHVTEDFPFEGNVLAFRVAGKIFSLTDINEFLSVNLKCDPERAIELRDRYTGIMPGYHMNKKHWNTILTDGSVSDELMFELTDHSYELIVNSFPAKFRKELGT